MPPFSTYIGYRIETNDEALLLMHKIVEYYDSGKLKIHRSEKYLERFTKHVEQDILHPLRQIFEYVYGVETGSSGNLDKDLEAGIPIKTVEDKPETVDEDYFYEGIADNINDIFYFSNSPSRTMLSFMDAFDLYDASGEYIGREKYYGYPEFEREGLPESSEIPSRYVIGVNATIYPEVLTRFIDRRPLDPAIASLETLVAEAFYPAEKKLELMYYYRD